MLLSLLLVAACDDPGREAASAAGGIDGIDSGADGAATDGVDGGGGGAGSPGGGDDDDRPGGHDDGGFKLDVGGGPGGDGPGLPPAGCDTPEHAPCDEGTSDPFAAMGLGCPGEVTIVPSTQGPDAARGIRSSLGATHTFDPTEGGAYAVIGTGLVAELDQVTPDDDGSAYPTYCNDDLGDFDPGDTLPAPLRSNDVAGDCAADPTLVGTGDCSNTIADQLAQGDSANDYVEMRISARVPDDVVSLSYDFAFLSTEYPTYYGSSFNDMYVGWLESESWTGNVSFDGDGNPISLNAGFLDFRDDDGTLPELGGTCMRRHAATDWLTTTSPVTPGEEITLVFAIFDVSDSALDSYALLDNFQWGCDPSLIPQTQPEG